MTETADQQPRSMTRLPTGIEGLDVILGGGLFVGGNYLIEGPPGAGKTILGNQLCFRHAAAGGRAIYLSLLAETNSRLLAELEPFAFYQPEWVGDAIYYLHGYSTLEREGREGLLKLIRQEVRGRRATLMALDGSSVIGQILSALEWMRLLQGLYVSAEITRCTTLLMTQSEPGGAFLPEETLVEGIIDLAQPRIDMRATRVLSVRKLRGSAFLEGQHHYTITSAGIVVHPRTEALLSAMPVTTPITDKAPEPVARASTGIPRLDAMMRGGLPAGSATLLLGAAGTGKTLLGSHFLLAGTALGEPGLYFGFQETPFHLERKLARFGFDVTPARVEGLLELLWHSPVQDVLDLLAERLLEAVARRHVRRLFIDGLAGFQRTVASRERLELFLIALLTRLREMEVTVVCSVELAALFSPTLELPPPVSAIAVEVDNLLFMRYVELQSQLYRLLSILKMRESGYDSAIREFRITEQGLDVAPTFDSAQAILTGVALPSQSRQRNAPFGELTGGTEGDQP